MNPIRRLQTLKQNKPRLYQMGLYLVFGIMTTLVNWVAYLLLTSLLGLALYPKDSPAYALIANVSQAVSWVVSVLFAYFTNRRFVFKSQSRGKTLLREMWQFVSARALGYLLFDLLLFNVFLLFLTDRWAKLWMNGFVIVFNYLASRFVVFRKPKAKPGSRKGTMEQDLHEPIINPEEKP